jgi:hypothetical protein
MVLGRKPARSAALGWAMAAHRPFARDSPSESDVIRDRAGTRPMIRLLERLVERLDVKTTVGAGATTISFRTPARVCHHRARFKRRSDNEIGKAAVTAATSFQEANGISGPNFVVGIMVAPKPDARLMDHRPPSIRARGVAALGPQRSLDGSRRSRSLMMRAIYLRQTWLSNTVFENYDAIVDAACHAWRNLTSGATPEKPSASRSSSSMKTSTTRTGLPVFPRIALVGWRRKARNSKSPPLGNEERAASKVSPLMISLQCVGSRDGLYRIYSNEKR